MLNATQIEHFLKVNGWVQSPTFPSIWDHSSLCLKWSHDFIIVNPNVVYKRVVEEMHDAGLSVDHSFGMTRKMISVAGGSLNLPSAMALTQPFAANVKTLADQVIDFLKDNAWSYGGILGQPSYWTHPLIIGPQILGADLHANPEREFEFAYLEMRKANWSIKNSPLSGPLGQVVQRLQNVSALISTRTLHSQLSNASIAPAAAIVGSKISIPKGLHSIPISFEIHRGPSLKNCDCGAEKCKTTHAHWCSAFDK